MAVGRSFACKILSVQGGDYGDQMLQALLANTIIL